MSDEKKLAAAGKVRGMVLAAGLGTRLRPLTLHRAKASVPFLNRPLIEYSFDLMRGACIDEFVVNLHYCPKSVFDVVTRFLESPSGRSWNPWILFSDESEILGTAGGIAKVGDFFRGGDFVVSNGKIYFEQQLEPVLRFHRENDATATMVLLKHHGEQPFNPVIMDEDRRIRGFSLKSDVKDFRNAYVFTGIQILSPEFFDFVPPGSADSVKDVYPEMIRRGRKVLGFVSQADWSECSVPSRYLAESLRILKGRGLENLFEDEAPANGAFQGVVAGPGVEFGTGCELENVVVWEGATVGPGARLRNVIIGDGLQLPAGVQLQDSLVTPLLDLRPGATLPESRAEQNYIVWPLR